MGRCRALASALAIVMCACGPAAVPAPSASAPVANANGCATESAQFDFWVGEWDLAVTDLRGSGVATESVTKQDCVVSEHFKGYFLGKPAYEATSTNSWNAALRVWQQRYVDPSGVYWYAGTFADGTMTLYAGTQGGARANTNRVLWTNISPSGLDWIWQRTTDDGVTWSVEQGRIRYTRRP
jgi:hypothetical protein